MFGVEATLKQCLRLLASLLAAAAVGVATNSGAEELPLSGYARLSWTTTEGTPADIWTLAVSPRGELWLGTGMGLFRFDGSRFDRYALRDGQRLTSDNINALYIAPSGEIWLGLYAGGAVRLKDGVLTPFDADQGLPGGRLRRFARTPDGALWAAAELGLARYDGVRWQRIGADWGFDEPGAHFVFTDSRGVLWVASPERLYQLQPGAKQFRFTGVQISTRAVLAEDRAGRVWLSEGLLGTRPLPNLPAVVDAPASAPAPAAPPGTVTPIRAKGMLFAEDGSLWFTELGHGVRRLRRAADVPIGQALGPRHPLETFTRQQGPTAEYMVPIVQGSEGEIWVGSNAGLLSFRALRLNVHPFGEGGPAGFSVMASGDGVLMVNGHRAVVATPPAPLKAVTLDSAEFAVAAPGEGGQVWMANIDGLWKDALGHRTRIRLDRDGGEFGIAAMAPDQHGGIWLSVSGRGVFHVDDQGAHRELRLDSQPSEPTAIAVDAAGAAWFGYDDEVIRLDPNGTGRRRFTSADGLRIGRCTTLHIGRTAIFVAGEAGLARLSQGRFSTLGAERDDAFAHVTGIVELANGDLWLNGGRGLVQVAAEDVPGMFRAPSPSLNYRLLDQRDGLPGIAEQAVTVPSLVLDAHNRLWVVTNRGVAWLEPDGLARRGRTRPAEIQGLRAGDRNFRPDPGLELPPGTKTVVFRYSSLTPASGDRSRFRYRLDGVDADWQDADLRREATYGNLGPGAYRFRVLVANADGVWSDTEAELPFSIAPRFFESRAFIVAVVLCLLVLGVLGYRLRTRAIASALHDRLEARHLERERIARDLHDTLLQGTQGLIVNIQGLIHGLPAQEPVRSRIEGVLDRADDVVHEMRERVRDLRTANLDGQTLLRALEDQGQELNAARGHQGQGPLIFRAVTHGPAQPLCRDVLDPLLEIGREALRNAFKHAQATQIEVEIQWRKTELVLAIRDDGVGVPAEWRETCSRPGHWGLVGMRERAEGIGARLTLVSGGQGAGTEVQVRVAARILLSAQEQLESGRSRFAQALQQARQRLGRRSQAPAAPVRSEAVADADRQQGG